LAQALALPRTPQSLSHVDQQLRVRRAQGGGNACRSNSQTPIVTTEAII